MIVYFGFMLEGTYMVFMGKASYGEQLSIVTTGTRGYTLTWKVDQKWRTGQEVGSA